jgi:hypothetical protein
MSGPFPKRALERLIIVAENAVLACLAPIAGDRAAIHRGLFPERAASRQAARRAFANLIAPEGKNG